jgi:16S rRNA (guanine1207-N2)-methyltransferase
MASDERRGEHYFSTDPQSASAERELVATFHGRQFVFRTDAGVFAQRFIDRGTRLLLSSLPVPFEGDVLDWGAGYGPIGVAVAALSPQSHVLMVEINERAASLAARNLLLNGVRNAEVLVGDALGVLGERQFDVVISNPPVRAGKQVLGCLIRDARARLRAGGQFWLVIRTQAGAKSYLALLQELFARAERVAMRGGYRVLRAAVDELPNGEGADR